MTTNKTSEAVQRNEGYSSMKPAEWFCIRQKYKRMEAALQEIRFGSIRDGKRVLMDKATCKEVADEALDFDPLA